MRVDTRIFWVIPAENELRWEIRQNDDNEFIPVVKANSSGTYQTNEEIELRGFKLQSFSSKCIYYLSQCTLNITISYLLLILRKALVKSSHV